MKVLLACLVSLIICIASASANAQSRSESKQTEACGQEELVQRPLIEEAEEKQFNVRRVEIVGNETIRHHEFVKRLRLNEGDIFTRPALENSIKRISKMDLIYPITLRNVEIRIDRDHRDVDIVFCVKQRSKE